MPIYLFKCPKCKKDTEIIMSFTERENSIQNSNEVGSVIVGFCSSKKCGFPLFPDNQQINFTGGINMNSNSIGVAKRKYSNRNGGPRPFVNGKLKPDMKPKW